MNTSTISGAGFVLPGGILSGPQLLRSSQTLVEPGPDGNALDGFDPKPYLQSVKGYLDPAAKFVLAAAALAIGETRDALRERGSTVGVVTATRWGATDSAFKFYRQLAEKGPRFASPLVFPHGYPSAAANILAMEFGFSGPHMVFFGPESAAEALNFASDQLRNARATDMIAVAHEAPPANTVPDNTIPLHGAVALHLAPPPLTIKPTRPSPNGATQTFLNILRDE